MATMEPMTIRLISAVEKDGIVRAKLRATVPGLGTRVWLEVRFRPPPRTGRAQWMEEAYDRALRVLDPA